MSYNDSLFKQVDSCQPVAFLSSLWQSTPTSKRSERRRVVQNNRYFHQYDDNKLLF